MAVASVEQAKGIEQVRQTVVEVDNVVQESGHCRVIGGGFSGDERSRWAYEKNGRGHDGQGWR